MQKGYQFRAKIGFLSNKYNMLAISVLCKRLGSAGRSFGRRGRGVGLPLTEGRYDNETVGQDGQVGLIGLIGLIGLVRADYIFLTWQISEGIIQLKFYKVTVQFLGGA